MITLLRRMGISSSMMYTAGMASVGLSVASWFASKNLEPASLARADRWGIFVGQWAPTFFALGCALRLEEQWGETTRADARMTEQPAPETMPVG